MSPTRHASSEHDATGSHRVHRACVPRRTVLAGASALAAASVAGCLGTGESAPAPVAVSATAACDECGMVISKHPGPNGELYWEETRPERHDAPFHFDSLKQCFFPHYFEGTDAGRSLDAAYVTDYSAVDYSVQSQDSASYVTSHTDADAFADATELQYVVESDVEGAMGPDFVPFSEASDAEAFADEYGGTVVSFDEISATLVGK